MRIALLGPLELTGGDRPADPGGPRPRTVLALLALNAGRPVPHEDLIAALWGEAPPRTARTQVQYCVSALRRTLAACGRDDAVTTLPSGYRLNAEPGDVDVTDFRHGVETARELAARGRLSDASDRLRTALDLWRGPALMGLDSEVLRRAAVRLEEGRLSAVEERARVDLALGRHHEIIGELRALADEEPLREGLHAHLMLALYRDGRQAEALEVYRTVRDLFALELGVEPGRTLRDLEVAILRADPRLDTTAEPTAAPTAPRGPVPRQLPPGIPDFTGRERHVAEVDKYLMAEGPTWSANSNSDSGARTDTDMHSGSSPGFARVLGISGREGVGKTALALHAAHRAVGSFPDGQLYADLHGQRGQGAPAQVIARFLRALGVAAPDVPDDPDERRAAYRSLVAGRRLLIVLDEAPGEALVRELLPAGPGSAVLVTSRSRLAGLPGVHHIHLDVLDPARALELLRRIVGEERTRAELPAAVELVEQCGGLPLALRIAGARLACRPHWPLARLVRRLRDDTARLDEFTHEGLDLRARLTLAHRPLGPRPRRLLGLLALLPPGAGVAPWTAAALLGTGLPAAEDAIADLLRAQLLDVTTDAGHRQSLMHLPTLVRDFAREQLSATQTAAHRDAAYERVLATWLTLAKQAHARAHGGHITLPHGRTARRGLPPEETAEVLDDPGAWWVREHGNMVAAVTAAAERGLDELCWDLALTCAPHFELRGATDDWRATAELALAACEEARNHRGVAAALLSLGSLHRYRQDLDAADRSLEQAREIFAAQDDLRGRACAELALARVAATRGAHDRAIPLHRSARKAFSTLGDPVGEVYAWAGQAEALSGTDPGRAARLLARALDLATETGSTRAEAHTVHRLAELALRTGQDVLAHEHFARGLRLARGTGDRAGEAHALHGLGQVHARAGRAGQSEAVLLQALTLARRAGDRILEGRVLYALGRAALTAGVPSVAHTQLGRAHEVFDGLGLPLWRDRANAARTDPSGPGTPV